MGIFKTREPKRFAHQYIYVDERKERLKEIEERAKRDLGMIQPKEATAEERIRGKIADQTTHLKRRKENDSPISTKRLILILALLAMILIVLLR
jgi:cell division protein FtsB